MTKREQILQSVFTILTGMTTVPATSVYRSRVSAFVRSEAPAVMLTWLRDTPTQNVLQFLDWEFVFRVSILSRGETPDSLSDDICEEVHSRLTADLTLGGLTMDLQPGAVDLQLIDADGGGSVLTMEFTAIYRTQLQDISS